MAPADRCPTSDLVSKPCHGLPRLELRGTLSVALPTDSAALAYRVTARHATTFVAFVGLVGLNLKFGSSRLPLACSKTLNNLLNANPSV